MIRPRSFPLWIVIFIGVLLLIFLRPTIPPFAIASYSTELFGLAYPRISFTSAYLRDVTNNTLGFERVFAVGLPERSDKRDAIVLTSSLTGFKMHWIDGVHGEAVTDKALPFGVNKKQLWESNLGGWRGHMNANRRKGLRIRPYYGRRYGLGCPTQITTPSIRSRRSLYSSIISPSPTVPSPQHAIGFRNFSANPFNRWVHVSGGQICSFAYALSQEGARKALYGLSVDGLTGAFDNALAGLCGWGREGNEGRERLDMRCVSVTPGYFVHHRAKGEVRKDSDIQKDGQGVRDAGTTENIV